MPSGYYQPMLSFAGSAPSEIQFSRTHSRFNVPSSRSSNDILCGKEWWTVSGSNGPTILNVIKFTKSKLSVYRWGFLYSLFTIYVSQNFKNPYHMFWFIRRYRLLWSHFGCSYWNFFTEIAVCFSRYFDTLTNLKSCYFTGSVIRVSAKRVFDHKYWESPRKCLIS